MYTLITGTIAYVTSLLLMPPARRWDIGVRSFCPRHVYFIDPTLGFPFKIPVPPTPQIVRSPIIEYAPDKCAHGDNNNILHHIWSGLQAEAVTGRV